MRAYLFLAFSLIAALVHAEYTFITYDCAGGTLGIEDIEGVAPKNLVVPSSLNGRAVTEIDYEAFEDRTFDSVTIPASITFIGEGAFTGESINYPKSTKASGVRSFYVDPGNVRYEVINGMLYDKVECVVIAAEVGLTQVVLPRGCRRVGEEAFKAKHSLSRVTPSAELRSLGYKAFSECSSLTELDFTATVLEEVDEKCFKNSWNLRSITFPSTLSFIGEDAFDEGNAQSLGRRSALETVTFLGSKPKLDPYCNTLEIFKGCKNLTFYVSDDPSWSGELRNGKWLGRPIKRGSGAPGEKTDSNLETAYGPLIPGVKIELDLGLVGYTAKGLPSGLKLDKKTGKVVGMPKRGDLEAMVTFTKKVGKEKVTASTLIRVAPLPRLSIAVEGDAKAKVKGAGSYLAGKKVNLAVAAPAGTAFIGWFCEGQPWPDEAGCRNPKVKYVMGSADIDLVALFKPEMVAVSCEIPERIPVKESVRLPVVVECESAVKSVTAKKLPAGMKYNKKTGCIEGAPKKAGTYVFQLTIQTTAKTKVTESFELSVEGNEGSAPHSRLGAMRL